MTVKGKTRQFMVGACGQVDRALDSRAEGLRFDIQCWPLRTVSWTSYSTCFGPPSCNGYLMHRSNVISIVAGCSVPAARECKGWRTCVVTWISGLWTNTFIVMAIHLTYFLYDFLTCSVHLGIIIRWINGLPIEITYSMGFAIMRVALAWEQNIIMLSYGCHWRGLQQERYVYYLNFIVHLILILLLWPSSCWWDLST